MLINTVLINFVQNFSFDNNSFLT